MLLTVPIVLQTAAPSPTPAVRRTSTLTSRFMASLPWSWRFRIRQITSTLERAWYVLFHPDFSTLQTAGPWIGTVYCTILLLLAIGLIIWYFTPKRRKRRKARHAAWVAGRPARKEARRKHRTPVSAQILNYDTEQTIAHPGGLIRGAIAQSVLGPVGWVVGMEASERIYTTVYVTFRITYEDGHTRERRVSKTSDACRKYSALCERSKTEPARIAKNSPAPARLQPAAPADTAAELAELDDLLQKGILTQTEYNRAKARMLRLRGRGSS